EPPQVVALIVIAVPAAMVLGQVKREDGPLREGNRLVGEEHGLARLVAPSGADIGPPGRLVLAVDGAAGRPRQAPLAAPVVVAVIERLLRRADARRRLDELDPPLFAGVVRGRGLHLELRQRPRALDRPPRTAQRKVWIVQQFYTKCRDVLHIG